MITFLHGVLEEKHPTRAVIDVGGVGYEVFIPVSSYDRLPSMGDRVRILTVDHVREDTHQLFGFMTEAERGMFLLLMGTSGIGPKLALSALSGLSVRDLKTAVVDGDVKRLSSISGIGKKMAERMVVDLRYRITDADAFEATAGESDPSEGGRVMRDALMALIALGYKRDAAAGMIKKVAQSSPGIENVEEMIKKALAR